ncbi:unnamed protein product [Gadus morhua 'NCC']
MASGCSSLEEGDSPTRPSAVQRGGPGAYGQAGDTPPGPGSILGITPPAQLMNDYCSLVADPDNTIQTCTFAGSSSRPVIWSSDAHVTLQQQNPGSFHSEFDTHGTGA